MTNPILRLSRSHPDQPRGHRVPQRIAKQMGRISSLEMAQAFVKSAGIDVLAKEGRSSSTAYSVSAVPSENQPFTDQVSYNYHAPQIVIPRIECELIPFGTVLINCLLPGTDLSRALMIFGEYQDMVQKFSGRIKTWPFACITGYKNRDPQHRLDQRGFRFFFSPQPDTLYDRIETILKTREASLSSSDHEEEKRLLNEFQQLKLGHMLLKYVGFQTSDTTLVDFR